VDAENRLRFTVPVAKLFFVPGDTPLAELASDPLLYVNSSEKQDRIAEMFDKYNLLTLPVIDEQQHLIGVITVDDVVALLRQA
jgi:magnesium transporter